MKKEQESVKFYYKLAKKDIEEDFISAD